MITFTRLHNGAANKEHVLVAPTVQTAMPVGPRRLTLLRATSLSTGLHFAGLKTPGASVQIDDDSAFHVILTDPVSSSRRPSFCSPPCLTLACCFAGSRKGVVGQRCQEARPPAAGRGAGGRDSDPNGDDAQRAAEHAALHPEPAGGPGEQHPAAVVHEEPARPAVSKVRNVDA